MRGTAGVLGGLLVAAAFAPGQASAAPSTATSVTGGCALEVASVNASGDQHVQRLTSAPPSQVRDSAGPLNLYPDGKALLAGAMDYIPLPSGGELRRSYTVIGQEMFNASYQTSASGGLLNGTFKKTKVGGGWYVGPGSNNRYFEQSTYSEPGFQRYNTYYLSGDNIYRWTTGNGWQNKTYFEGFGGVKTMTLISQAKTYDTFLANGRGGALWTIRIPVKGAPIVKKVRTATWQVFETLIAEKCGSQSTLLLGIDQDTKTGYLYAVSHATGATTVIKGLGKVPATFASQTYSRHFPGETGNLNGE
jgi:hypothetical protein